MKKKLGVFRSRFRKWLAQLGFTSTRDGMMRSTDEVDQLVSVCFSSIGGCTVITIELWFRSNGLENLFFEGEFVGTWFRPWINTSFYLPTISHEWQVCEDSNIELISDEIIDNFLKVRVPMIRALETNISLLQYKIDFEYNLSRHKSYLEFAKWQMAYYLGKAKLSDKPIVDTTEQDSWIEETRAIIKDALDSFDVAYEAYEPFPKPGLLSNQ